MATLLPKVRGTAVLASNNGVASLTLPIPAGTANGDLLFAVVQIGSTSTITDAIAKGWTTPVHNLVVNTRRDSVFVRKYNSADPTSVYTLTISTTASASAATISVYDHGAVVNTDAVLGPTWKRPDQVPTSRADIVIPSVTSPKPALVLAFFGEATTAAGTWSWQTQNGFTPAVEKPEGTTIEWVGVHTKGLDPGGATGDAVMLFTQSSANGFGVQIAVPAIAGGTFEGSYGWGPPSATGLSPVSGGFSGTIGWGEALAAGSTSAEGAFGASVHYGPATAAGGTPASGGFEGSYGWGPAEHHGSATARGLFGGTYGWRPAQGEGGAAARGSFGGQITWGPAAARGDVAVGGGFSSTYGWGPARGGGLVVPVGQFGGLYRFGPAIAGGEALAGGDFGSDGYGWGPAEYVGPYVRPDFCWPLCTSLVENAPRITLSPAGPRFRLSTSESCLTLIEGDAC